MSKYKLLGSFAKDEHGNMAALAALSIVALLSATGAAIDYNIASKTKTKAQNVADAAALAAAVNVGNLLADKTSTADRNYLAGKDYKGSDFGQPFKELVEDDAKVTFEYDDDAGEVIVTVVGNYQTTFANILGIKSVPVSVRTTAEYPEVELKHPASIALVIDNSNSMYYDEHASAEWDQTHYDTVYSYERSVNGRNHTTADYEARTTPTGLEVRPSDTTQRIASIKSAITSLNDFLDTAVGGDEDQKYLRMGLIPFNHNFISSKQSKMDWGPIPQSKINAMEPSGETDTSKGMDKALNYLNSDHSKYDKSIRDDLKRYVILMTDGRNTVSRRKWQPESGTDKWRGQEQHTTPARTRTYRDCQKYETYYTTSGEAGAQKKKRCVKWGPTKTENIPAKTKWRWVTRNTPNRPTDGKNWTEGDWEDATVFRCNQFKKNGWEIYTVGYALNSGIYKMNVPSTVTDKEYWGTNPEDIDEAVDLLRDCASSEDHFVLANDAEELEKAFESIGASIASDTQIRIKS